MSDLAAFFSVDEEAEILADFLDEFKDKYEEVEKVLHQLENNPQNTESLNALFRAVHTVKGSASFCQLTPIVDYTHCLENTIDRVRQGAISFSHQLSEAIMLSMDRLMMIAREVTNLRQVNLEDFDDIQHALAAMSSTDGEKFVTAVDHLIAVLSGDFSKDDTSSIESELLEDIEHAEDETELEKMAVELDEAFQCAEDISERDEDLMFFRRFAEAIDMRHKHRQGRTDFIIRFAAGMNGLAHNPVDFLDLEAAACLHDAGLSIFADDILRKEGELTEAEFENMRQHPLWSAQLIDRMKHWQGAREIVLQHHERMDGSGYPSGLKGDSICDGAQIIAICDAFYSMTHSQQHRHSKRSVLRAVAEINALAGTQFGEGWVNVFNLVVKIQHKVGHL